MGGGAVKGNQVGDAGERTAGAPPAGHPGGGAAGTAAAGRCGGRGVAGSGAADTASPKPTPTTLPGEGGRPAPRTAVRSGGGVSAERGGMGGGGGPSVVGRGATAAKLMTRRRGRIAIEKGEMLFLVDLIETKATWQCRESTVSTL